MSVLALVADVAAATEERTFQWVLVLSCWAVVLAAVAVVAVRSAQRGRRLARQVPEEQRRWM